MTPRRVPARRLAALAVPLVFGGRLAAQAAQAEPPRADLAQRPNVVVLLSDDQGYGDVGAYGAAGVSTPRIDRLAGEGARFTAGYVTAPMCSPSRAGLVTGRYQYRFGYVDNDEQFEGLPTEEVTIAEHLKGAGYATGVVGKWHLGRGPGSTPADQGFDEFFGFWGGARSYLRLKVEDFPLDPIRRGDEELDLEGYLTDVLADEAASFVERHAAEPFFLYVAFNAPHTPLELPPGEGEGLEGRELYLEVVRRLDDGVGRVLDALEREGLAEDTLVFFLSDNGGAAQHGASNRPYRGAKFKLWEGGIRIPFLLRWPRRIEAGTVCDVPVISLDVLATSIAAAGVPAPTERPLDGVDLLPVLAGEVPDRALHWIAGPDWAVRRGDLKLIANSGRQRLFDLSSDPGEGRELNMTRGEDVGRLSFEYRVFLADVTGAPPPEPRNPRPPRRRPRR